MTAPVRRIVLAYSGGLDTSVILRWLVETYHAEVVTFCADLGQEEELDGLDAKARATGATKCIVDDLRVGSRPYGQSVWVGKPGAVVSVSPGLLGAFGANHHLRQSLVFLDVPTMQQPEVYLSNAAKLFDADGKLTNEGTKEFLESFIDAFAHWIERTSVTA